MQLANGCGSGTLYTVGGGSGRMLVTLAFFIAGSVIGSLHLPAFLRLGGVDPILAANYLGAVGRPRRHLGEPRAGRARRRRRSRGGAARRSRRRASIVIGAIAIGLLCIAVFAAGHHPWSVTFGFTVWGAKIATLFGADFSGAEFWQWAGPKRALGEFDVERHVEPDRLRHDPRRDGGCRRPARRSRATPWPPLKSLLAAAVGGLLMGWGARLGFGCNIGAFVGGVASGSLHGWVWFAAALPGCMDRHQAAAAVRPVARVTAMRIVYAIVFAGRLCRDRRPASDLAVERTAGLAGGFRRRLRAVRRAVSVSGEEVARYAPGVVATRHATPCASPFPRSRLRAGSLP